MYKQRWLQLHQGLQFIQQKQAVGKGKQVCVIITELINASFDIRSDMSSDVNVVLNWEMVSFTSANVFYFLHFMLFMF